MDKLNEYQGFAGRLHGVRDGIKEKAEAWKSAHPEGVLGSLRQTQDASPPKLERSLTDYPHIYRRKTRAELVRISTAVMGIEFSYAAETAFVSPTLLKIVTDGNELSMFPEMIDHLELVPTENIEIVGLLLKQLTTERVEHKLMTMVWGLSPIVGFILTPLLGSVSDGCTSKWGRRRPFILLLSIGVFGGLLLVPNGEDIGHALGDFYPSIDLVANSTETGVVSMRDADYPHPWGIVFTILGTVLLDFNADSCQSPARAYLLDVCLPVDHARGLSTFTVMAGLGGFFGYALGGINWEETSIGELLGGHVRAVFTFITVLFIFCVSYTITSFKEIPLDLLQRESAVHERMMREAEGELEKISTDAEPSATYGATETVASTSSNSPASPTIPLGHPVVEEIPSLKEYLLSIVYMPNSLRLVCLTSLFCWMAHVCYSLYFTDFVGEAVYNGQPQAAWNTEARNLYEEGVRFGCWGMSVYSLSCSCYSLCIERLIKNHGARNVYMGGLLFYSVGMFLMGLTRSQFGVIVFSWAAGVMYSTLFTMPYLLVARYHATGIFAQNMDGSTIGEATRRGLGTDVAIVSSVVFVAQFILSMGMGSIISWSGTTTAVPYVASFLAFCASISAYFIVYLDL